MAPKPPIAPSSTVTSTSCSRASRRIRSRVERLGEARVGDRRRQAEGGELLGGRQAFAKPRAEGEERDRRCPRARCGPCRSRAACRRWACRRRRPRRADSGRRSGRSSIAARGRDHVDELGLVGRRHHHEARQAAEIGDVEGAGMGRAVGADEAGAVDGEAHRQRLDRDVVDDLVVGALQEGRIDRGERLQALGGEAGGEGHARAARRCRHRSCARESASANRSSPVPDGIAAVMATILSSVLGFLDQALGEDLGVGRRVRLRLGLRAGDDVELGDAVILVGRTPRPARSPCPSWSRRGRGSGRSRCRGRSAAPAGDGRDCARRSGRHSRSRAPRTACRRSRSRGRIPRPARPRRWKSCGRRFGDALARSRGSAR